VYLLTKFQLHILITYGVIALQSSNNRTIDCTASIGETITGAYKNGRNLQTDWGTELQFRLCTYHEQGKDYWISFPFTHPSSLHLKAKIMKKKLIAYNRFDVT